MTSALAIAAVTATLKGLLHDHLTQQAIAARVGDVAVTALPPDRVPTGHDERGGLNLFLYRVAPHSRWAGARVDRGDADEVRNGRAPLALDLHYLVAAYGQADLDCEILLGFAVQALLQTPSLTPAMLEDAIEQHGGRDSKRPSGKAATADGARLEPLVLSPQFLNVEEMTKLWSALQARYRPSAAYKVAAIVIRADE